MLTVSKALEKALLQHFMHQKLEIAYAIHKPFPFFEALRDNSFITETVYRESLEACKNLVPVSRVVHNILTKLEKSFSLSLLVTLFSQINLREYPDLMAIFRSFRSVGASYGAWSRTTPVPLKAPTDSAEGSSLQTLLPLPPPRPPPPGHLSCAPRVSEPRASSQQIVEITEEPRRLSDPAMPLPGFTQEGRGTPVTSDNLTSKAKEEEDSQEMPSPPPGTVQVSFIDNKNHQIKDNDDSQEMPLAPTGPPAIRDDPPEPNDPEEPQEAPSTSSKKKGKKRKRCIWYTPKKRQRKKINLRGAATPGHGIPEKLQVADRRMQRTDDSAWNSKVVTGAQKARTACAQTPRSEEKPEDDAGCFLSPTLPVICGEAKGILYVEKMKGSSEKCIQSEEGTWFTPNEFLIEGKRGKSKDWKKKVYCRGQTLRNLQKALNECVSCICSDKDVISVMSFLCSWRRSDAVQVPPAMIVRDSRAVEATHGSQASSFDQEGLSLEAEFEKDLREVLGAHEEN